MHMCTVGWVYFGKLGDQLLVFWTFTNLNTYPYYSVEFLVKKTMQSVRFLYYGTSNRLVLKEGHWIVIVPKKIPWIVIVPQSQFHMMRQIWGLTLPLKWSEVVSHSQKFTLSWVWSQFCWLTKLPVSLLVTLLTLCSSYKNY